MKKAIFTLCALMISLPAFADGPARRPRPALNHTTINAKALCRDEQYDCMYNCEIEKGYWCMPTKASDPQCPARQVTGAIIDKKFAIVRFGEYPEMGCKVTSPARTNLYCGPTEFSYGCWIGKMRNR